MLYDKHLPHRRFALLLASSWCLTVALSAEPADLPLYNGKNNVGEAFSETRLPELPAKDSLVATNAPASSGNRVDEKAPQTLPDSVERGNPPTSDPGAALSLMPTIMGTDSAALASANVPINTGDAENAPADSGSPAPKPAKSRNVTINLINRMVERGLLTKEDANDLIKQAQEDAADARTQANEIQAAASQAVQTAQAAAAQVASQSAPSSSDDAVRVTYVPEIVKAQMRDEIKEEVMAQARDENWAAPRTLPGWVTRYKLFGDIRVRYNGSFYPDGNDNKGAFPNFNAINTGAPFDPTGTVLPAQYNVDQTRQSFRLRARMGAEADMGDNFTAGVRIATGENNSPTSTNQSFGLANQAQGGNFSKYAIWLDRAFLKYELGGLPSKDLEIGVGRFDNPFFTTSELLWDDDLGFDGVALKARYEVVRGLTPFFTAGAFPVFNTDLNFSSNQPAKFKSEDKYLYGGQFGVNWKITKDLSAKVAAAYYYFDNIEGKLSDPFVPLNAQDQGDTDDSRPSFAQRGNTYMALRNIVPTFDKNNVLLPQFQYFGLATPFHELAFNGRLDYNHFEPIQISLFGDFVKNLAFDSGAIDPIAVNNLGHVNANGDGTFAGGNTGWIVGLKVGSPVLENRWDWNAFVNYRYLESDAVVDGMNDSDFGGGGTNLKGYTIGAAVALSPRVSLGLRWLSATAITGPTYKNDIIQFDINGKF